VNNKKQEKIIKNNNWID